MKLKSENKSNLIESVIVSKEIFGLLLFIFLFVLIIPIILYKNNLYYVLEVYLPNVDLVAILLTWSKGPHNIWENLYKDDNTIFDFTSKTFINYMALLGVTYIVARETKKSNSVFEGMSFALVMLLCTYLLPGDIIVWFMNKTYKKLRLTRISYNNSIITTVLTILTGVFVTITFLFAEIAILKNYRKYFKKTLKQFSKLPKYYLK